MNFSSANSTYKDLQTEYAYHYKGLKWLFINKKIPLRRSVFPNVESYVFPDLIISQWDEAEEVKIRETLYKPSESSNH